MATGISPRVVSDNTYAIIYVFYVSAATLYFYTNLSALSVTIGSFPDANKTDFDVDWDETNTLTVKYRDAADAVQTWKSHDDGATWGTT